MGDNITYAEVEIVRFMKPKIRTRHQSPKNKLHERFLIDVISSMPKSKCLYKAVNAKCVDTLDLLILTWRGGLGFLMGEARLKVLKSIRIMAKHKWSCYSADKRHKQGLVSVLDNE